MTKMPSLPALQVGTAARQGGVTVLPIFATAPLPPAAYALGADAIGRGELEIHELRQSAADQLRAHNRGRRPALLVEGDHLLGAKQNRMLTSSALVGGGRRVVLPVACVERGRWQGPSARFDGVTHLGSPRLRRIAKLAVTRSLIDRGRRVADQSQIWNQIARQQQTLQVRSATSALSHTYAARATDIGAIADRLPYPDGATGVAVGIGAELVSIDVFDDPRTCAHYWRRLIEGAALDSLGAAPPAPGIGGGEVARVLDELRAAEWAAVAAVGDGDELRAHAATAAGSLLILDGRVVHFGAATHPAGTAPRGRATVDSRLAVMRHDLPESLAARFEVVGRIGVGGSKEVFRAVDRRGGPDVAIARIPGVDTAQFEAEVALLRRVQSEHVPRILDAHVDPYGDAYLVMERCDGPNLAQLVGRGPLSIADAAPLLLAFARGLEAIHAAHVLHRDIKLENVMLASGEAGPELKILDFGLSERAVDSITAVSSIRIEGGTLPYMAHEVIVGEPVDARSDVYAFGVSCFRILVGEFPIPPRERELATDYLARLRATTIDPAPLPAELPPAARAMIVRMLDRDRDRRPFMPEVVAAFEQAFGASPLAAAPRVAPSLRPPRPLALARAYRLAVPVASPEHLLVAPCTQAPFVVLAPDAWGIATHIRAIAPSGMTLWRRRLDGHLVTGLRADLDGDGVREIYVAGRDGVVALGTRGAVRFALAAPASRVPSLIALADPAAPRLAVDGRALDVATGADRGALPFLYRGNGRELVVDDDPRGVAYNGFALQGFGSAHGAAAAVIHHPGEPRFAVAQLEQTRTGRVQLGVYGPGGARLHHLAVADCQVDTGDLSAISRVYGDHGDRRAPLFGPEHAPLAVLGERGSAVVIVPLLDPDDALPPTLVGFELPSGRELWRHRPATPGGRALLADLDGSRPQLVVGDGSALVAYDAWTGQPTAPLACTGLPVAFGDPLATGSAHLITAGPDGIELWRGPRCPPGAMAWTGARGDLWRTGTLRLDGRPLGPV